MSTSTSPRLGHVAIGARDPHHLAAFYRDLLGFQIVRSAGNRLTGDAVLLSGDPAREDHELALFANSGGKHVAFRVDTAAQLRAFYRRAKRRGLEIPYALDSSVAVGFFVRDPEGNAIEVYFARSKPAQDRPPMSDPDEIERLILGDSMSERMGTRDA